MRLKAILAGAALAAILIMPIAQAGVFYSNPYDPNSSNAFGSDDVIPQYSFADYYWDGAPSISDFHWWGTISEPQQDHSFIDGFHFEIWSHDGGTARPDQLLYSEFFAGDAGATFVETNAQYDLDVYKYGINLSTPFTPAGSGYLWFSVWAEVNTEAYWYWAMSDSDPFNTDWATIPPTWYSIGDYEDYGFAFELTDDGTVPEPGTLALFGVGLIGMAVRRFRRK